MPLFLSFTAPVAWATPPVPADRSAQGIRAFLSVPVWYLDFEVTVVVHGRNGGGLTTAHTAGIVGLGMRSQGPALLMDIPQSPLSAAEQQRLMRNPSSLTRAQIEALANSSAGVLAQIDNAANWMMRPATEQSGLTYDETTAIVKHWIDSTAVEQHVEYKYDSAEEHAYASGTGRLMPLGHYMFELDVVKKKFVVNMPWVFGDRMQTIGGVRGERRVLRDGHWDVEPIVKDFGMMVPASYLSLVPEAQDTGNALVLKGTLPEVLGPVSGQDTFQVKFNQQEEGTLTFRYTVSPNPPQPIELVIKLPNDYKKWRPEGLDDEQTMGNSLDVTAVLQKTGGGDPPFKASRIHFELLDTSHEPGICMNWPHVPQVPSPPDFKFEGSRNPDFMIDDDELGATQTVSDDVQWTVTVSSFDYGGHAGLQVTAELTNGDVIIGVVEGTTDERSLKLPSRPVDSHVADVYLDHYSVAAQDDDADLDDEPKGDGFNGDGLTLYEEYRGFMEAGDWAETDPTEKDLFVVNQMRWHGSTWNGIAIYKRVTELKVHPWLLDSEARSDGMINFNHAAEPHVVDQYAITIVATDNPKRGFANAEKIGTPGTAKKVHMPAATWPTFRPGALDSQGGRYMAFAATLAHEMLHATNVSHHGEVDDHVTWRLHEPLIGDAYVEESGGSSGTTEISVRTEGGTVVEPKQLFAGAAKTMKIWLGEPQCQHSGAWDCLMRYDCSEAYRAAGAPKVRYLTGGEPVGDILCANIVGSGVNVAGRTPQSRYQNAAPPDPARGVLMQRGNCRAQFRVNDLGTEPER